MNLAALPTRLVRIWRRRERSPRTRGGYVISDEGHQLDSVGAGGRREQRGNVLHRLVQVERLGGDLQIPRFDLGEIEDVVDDRQQRFAGRLDRVKEPLLPLIEPGVAEQSGHAEHAVHRGADLVAHVGQELRFRKARRLRIGDRMGKLAVALLELRGARMHLFLQPFPVAGELLVARADGAEHAVEPVDQLAQLVLAGLFGPDRIVLLPAHPAHLASQAENREGDQTVPHRGHQHGKADQDNGQEQADRKASADPFVQLA